MRTETHAETMTGDILTLLKNDHQRVSHLLDQIEDTDDTDERRREQLFAQMAGDLEAHSHAEDDVLYATLEDIGGDLEDVVDESRQEHEHIEQLLEELDEMEVSDADWLDKIRELRQLIHHHVEEEEGKVFALCRERIGASQLGDLADQFLRAKEEEQAELSSERPRVEDGEAAGGPRIEPAVEVEAEVGEQDIQQMSKKELYDLARQRGIDGRSAMTKTELIEALRARH